MKAYKKFLALMTALFIVSSVSILGLQGIEEHWSYTFVRQLIDRQLLNTPQNKEELDLYVSREDFFSLLRDHKLADKNLTDSLRKKLNGLSGGTFVTREQACIILGDLLIDGYTSEIGFSDLAEISPEAVRAMQKLNYFYIIDGYPNGNFSPKVFITRAETLKLLTVMLKIPKEYFAPASSSAQTGEEFSSPVSVASVYIEVREGNDTPIDNGLAESIVSDPPTFSIGSDASAQAPSSAINPMAEYNLASSLELPTRQAPSLLSISAETGSVFRSINVSIKAQNGGFSEIYYLALETGAARPLTQDIISYAKGDKLDGLTDGSAVRGKLVGKFDDTELKLTLGGGEGVIKTDSETGFIDGYNYDLYMVGVDYDGRASDIAEYKRVMAMPFDASDPDGRTYTIRALSMKQIEQYPDLQASNKHSKKINHTARQLENIQRLADLYVDTGGRHGDIQYLTGRNTYVLDSNIDLAEYMSFDDENGWRPIGDADANDQFYFGGSFDGKSNRISNLYIDRDADLHGEKVSMQGLFGKTNGATIRNIELDRAKIIVQNTNESYIGAVVGYAVNSVINSVTVNSLSLNSSSKGGGADGGLIGFADNTDIDRITINNAVITTKATDGAESNNPYYTGGVAGRYKDMGMANLLSNIFVSGEIVVSVEGEHDQVSAASVGGAAGLIECLSDNHSIYAARIDACVSISGDAQNAGGIAGMVVNKSTGSTITFEKCYAAGSVEGISNIGGIFGRVSAVKNSFVLKDSRSDMDVGSDNINAVIGGVVAHTDGGSYESCEAIGSTLVSRLMRIGGFVGYVTGDADFLSCMSSKSIEANRAAGGFAGEVNGSAKFLGCGSEGALVTAYGEDSGGFIGLHSGGDVTLSDCFSTSLVNGAINAGGLAGRVGANGGASEFVNCFSAGDIKGTSNTGGFIGRLENESIIIDSYSTGKVEVDGSPGNFIGNRQSFFEEG